MIRVKSREWVKKDRLYLSDEYTVEWKSLKERYFTNISDLSEELRMSEEKRDDTWVIKGKGLKFVKKEKLKYILLDVK